jgi:hypothetical protein
VCQELTTGQSRHNSSSPTLEPSPERKEEVVRDCWEEASDTDCLRRQIEERRQVYQDKIARKNLQNKIDKLNALRKQPATAAEVQERIRQSYASGGAFKYEYPTPLAGSGEEQK